MVMLKQGTRIFLFLLLASCNNNSDVVKKTNEIKNMSANTIGVQQYDNLLHLVNDSIKIWKLNKLRNYGVIKEQSDYIVDSLICINNNKNRLVTCLLSKVLLKPNPTAGITFLYGEKIEN